MRRQLLSIRCRWIRKAELGNNLTRSWLLRFVQRAMQRLELLYGHTSAAGRRVP